MEKFDLIVIGGGPAGRCLEIGLLMPPFAISVFAVHDTLDGPKASVEEVFLGRFPCILVMLSVLVAIASFQVLLFKAADATVNQRLGLACLPKE